MSERRIIDGKPVPVIPKLPDDVPSPGDPVDPNPVVAVCGECGMTIRLVMGYSCRNPRCPCGFGSPRCMTNAVRQEEP